MITLPNTLVHWGRSDFDATLKTELGQLDHRQLPLQYAVTEGGMVDNTPIDACILNSQDDGDVISVRASIFFNELVPSCSCGDDPVSKPVHCDLVIRIHKATAEASFDLCR